MKQAPKSARVKVAAGEESVSAVLRISNEDMLKLAALPVFFVTVATPKKFKVDGADCDWFVCPVRLENEQLVNVRTPIACVSRAEADATTARLVKQHQQEEAERKRKEAEKPVPGATLRFLQLANVRRATISGTPLCLIKPEKKLVAGSSETTDEHFDDVVNAYWKSVDGTQHAMKAMFRKDEDCVDGFRMIRYAEAIRIDGKAFSFGVERAELNMKGQAMRVAERWPCETEAAAAKLFAQKEKEAPSLRAKMLGEQPKSAAEQKEELIISELLQLAKRAHDLNAKARHLKRIEEIRADQAERKRAAGAAVAEKAKAEKEKQSAFDKLLDENFPAVANVKTLLAIALEADKPALREKLRRAMREDCARLGIPSPVQQFMMDDEFTLNVAKAVKSKSPFKPAQVVAVLNWVAKGYESMPEKEWASEVEKQIKMPVNAAGLGKTISKKFGLKSKLKGRPETESER
jgi:hypothetical protein